MAEFKKINKRNEALKRGEDIQDLDAGDMNQNLLAKKSMVGVLPNDVSVAKLNLKGADDSDNKRILPDGRVGAASLNLRM